MDNTDIGKGVFVLNNGNAPLNITTLAASTNSSVRRAGVVFHFLTAAAGDGVLGWGGV